MPFDWIRTGMVVARVVVGHVPMTQNMRTLIRDLWSPIGKAYIGADQDIRLTNVRPWIWTHKIDRQRYALVPLLSAVPSVRLGSVLRSCTNSASSDVQFHVLRQLFEEVLLSNCLINLLSSRMTSLV